MNDGATINDLVTKMIERYGEKFKNFLTDYRDKRAVVLLDGKYTYLETKLVDGNKLFFMLPYCGG
jgi:molybdopterin converting factor small subunit